MMETKIKTLNELKPGDLVLIDFVTKDDLCTVSSVTETEKYAITQNGRKMRYELLPPNHPAGRKREVWADEQGDTGNETIKCWAIDSSFGGHYSLDELDDISNMNIRKIDDTHPRYDSALADRGSMFDKILNMFDKFM